MSFHFQFQVSTFVHCGYFTETFTAYRNTTVKQPVLSDSLCEKYRESQDAAQKTNTKYFELYYREKYATSNIRFQCCF